MKQITLRFSIVFCLLLSLKLNAQITVTPSGTSGCAPYAVIFTNTTPNVAYCNWYFGDGPGDNAISPAHTFTQPGMYYVNCYMMDSTFNSIGYYNVTISVNGMGDSIYTSSQYVCPGDLVGLSLPVFYSGPGSASNVTWDFGDGSILTNTDYMGIQHTYSTAGTYIVSAIATTSCGTDTAYQVIHVITNNAYFPPFTGFEAAQDSICPGDNALFNINYYFENYMINFGDGQYSTTENTHIYTIPGVYYPYITYINGCGNTLTISDTVYIINNMPVTTVPDIFIQYNPSCINTPVNFFAYPDIYSEYSWAFGTSVVHGQTTTNTYNAVGNYPVFLTVNNSCGNSLTIADTVNILPSVPLPVSLNAEVTDSVCPGGGINYGIQGGNGDHNEYSYSWNFGDGQASSSYEGTHTYTAAGTYTVTANISNACGNTAAFTNTVYVGTGVQPDLSQMFFETLPSSGCVGDTILFLFGPGGPTAGTMTIDFGDGNTGTFNSYLNAVSSEFAFIKHAYATSGNYMCHYTFTNGCGLSDTDSTLIQVGSSIPSDGQFVWDEDKFPCQGSDITFYAWGGTNYIWNFGDGTGTLATTGTFTPVLHAFENAGQYDVTVQTINGCGSSETLMQTITIPPSKISITTNSVSANCTEANGKAIAIASGGTLPYTYQWSNGDSHFIADSITSGIYVVTVTDANNCRNYSIATVNDAEAPTIIVNTVLNVSCFGGDNGAIDINLIGSTSPYSYHWSNGSVSEDVNHLVAGPHEVTVTDANGCTASKSINVSGPPEVILSMTVDNASCGGSADGAAYVNVNGSTGPYSYIWSSGGNLQQITGLTAGIYTVTVIDLNGCIYEKSVALSEENAPVIITDSILGTGCTNNLSSIFITPMGGTSPYTYAWSNSTTSQDLVNVALGTYSVTVTDNAGCKSTQFMQITKDEPAGNPVCLVTVDTASGTNRVIWEKDASATDIDHYNIYKESSLSGLYYLIDQVDYDSLSEYTDWVSNPQIRSWRYKISVVDDCGNESELSEEHKTIHLTVNSGLAGAWNLIWDNYEGFTYATYEIRRFTAATGWLPLTTIPSNLNSYTDLTAPADSTLGYRVDAVADFTCNPTRATVNTSRSNIKHTSSQYAVIGISENELLNAETLVFPNPANEYVNVVLPALAKNARLQIISMLGQTVYAEDISAGMNQTTKQINTGDLAKGVYTITVETGAAKVYKKLVIN